MVRVMLFPGRRSIRIHGVEIPRRRFTAWAALYFVAFVCLPVFTVALIFDYLLYVLLVE